MEKFTQALYDGFGIDHIHQFQPDAVYFEEMDCVEYLEKDVKTTSDRIDDLLTISYDKNGEPVGFTLKGFRNFFIRELQDLYEFTEDDFIQLIEVIVMICKDKAPYFKSSTSPNGDHINKAYKTALSMARRNNPKLSLSPLRLAA